MANENKLENIMLTGQNAYFKKEGSMTNHGTIELENALSSHNYEGYIGPNSVLHGTDLAETNEYAQCESLMHAFLEDAWEEKENERTIITNANNTKNTLLPGENNMQQLYNDIQFDGIELTYIRFTGTQFIDTKIIPTNHMTEIKFDFGTYSSDEHLFGTSLAETYYHFTTYNDKYYWGQNGVEANGGSFTTGIHTLVYNGENYSVVLDGTQLGTGSKIASSTTLWLGRRQSATNLQGTIYYVKITDKSTGRLVRDFIPCKDPNGTVCLYDKITKQYFYNSGTGTFTAGSEANPDYTHTELEYIESTGSQYINLGIRANETSGFSIDFMSMEDFESTTSTGSKCIIAAGGNGSGIKVYPYINICSKPDYPKGSIQIGKDSIPLNADLVQYERTKIELKNSELTLKNGTKVTTEQGIPSNLSNWRLFNFYTIFGTVSAYSKTRLYSCKIYEGDTVVMDLVPAKDKHNIGCVYDKISEKLIYPNSKTLKLGPVKNI